MKENSIEKDIKILEEMIENANVENMDMNDCFGGEHIEAIEHILSDYKKILKEAKRYKNMYAAEHQIHLVRNEQLDRKQKAIIKCNELEVENKELKKENAELKEKWDKDTHRLQNYLDVANADKFDLIQQNEELRHKVAGQLCVIETQAHNEEVYERTFVRLKKENEELKNTNYTMAEYIASRDIDEDICKYINCGEGDKEKEECIECIIDFFKEL